MTTIALNKLIAAKANVRRTGATDGIEDLAASILRRQGTRQEARRQPWPAEGGLRQGQSRPQPHRR